MKEFWKALLRKLSSRKLWTAVCGIAVGVAAAFKLEENDIAQIAGIVTSAVSVAAYIFGEARIDSIRLDAAGARRENNS